MTSRLLKLLQLCDLNIILSACNSEDQRGLRALHVGPALGLGQPLPQKHCPHVPAAMKCLLKEARSKLKLHSKHIVNVSEIIAGGLEGHLCEMLCF